MAVTIYRKFANSKNTRHDPVLFKYFSDFGNVDKFAIILAAPL